MFSQRKPEQKPIHRMNPTRIPSEPMPSHPSRAIATTPSALRGATTARAIGIALAALLLSSDHQVTVLDDLSTGSLGALRQARRSLPAGWRDDAVEVSMALCDAVEALGAEADVPALFDWIRQRASPERWRPSESTPASP